MTRQTKWVVLALGCGILFVLGLLAAVIGPALPDIGAQTGSTVAEAGALFTALFLGALISQLAVGPINDHLGPRPVLLVGLLVMALGIAGVALSPALLPALGAMFFAGLGDGLVVVSINVLLGVVFASRSVTALGLTNVFYGIGAVSGPTLATLAGKTVGSAVVVLWVVAVILVALGLSVPFLRVEGNGKRHGEAKEPDVPVPAAAPASLYRTPVLWVLGAMLMIYVGTELSAGSWGITILNAASGTPEETAALVVSGYWLALTAGRLVGSFVGMRVGPWNLLVVALAGASTGTVAMALSNGSEVALIGGLLLMGVFLGPVYPTIVAVTTMTFRESPGKAVGVVTAFASVGGMVLPWLTGNVIAGQGPYPGVALILAAMATMLLLHTSSRIFAVRRSMRYEA